MRGQAKRLAVVVEAERGDTKERVECLRLQCFAWRQLAIIASHDQVFAKNKMQWLMFNSVPFVNGEALKTFIDETKDYAIECGKKSGVLA